jgi:RimJ/RimL family protein N-acetyltransferase
MFDPKDEKARQSPRNQQEYFPSLRLAQTDDEQFLLTVRNHPEIVRLSSSQRIVTPGEHRTWFKSMLISERNMLLIAQHPYNESRIGYARLDCQSAETALITVALLPKVQGKGFGTRLIHEVCELGFQRWSELREILAVIRKDNKYSLAAFMKAGFVEIIDESRQRDYFLMSISSHDGYKACK